MSCYVAFDVETPNRMNNRMSAIGIAVVEDGRIAEDGSHEELITLPGGHYRGLCEAQYRFMLSA